MGTRIFIPLRSFGCLIGFLLFVYARNPWDIPVAGIWNPFSLAPIFIFCMKELFTSRNAWSHPSTRNGRVIRLNLGFASAKNPPRVPCRTPVATRSINSLSFPKTPLKNNSTLILPFVFVSSCFLKKSIDWLRIALSGSSLAYLKIYPSSFFEQEAINNNKSSMVICFIMDILFIITDKEKIYNFSIKKITL